MLVIKDLLETNILNNLTEKNGKNAAFLFFLQVQLLYE